MFFFCMEIHNNVINMKRLLFSIAFYIIFITKLLSNPTGDPVITVFAGHHAGLGRYNEKSGFELTRAYIGYQFELSPALSGKVIVDAANPSSGSSSTSIVLKHAQLTWSDKGFTVNAGMIGLLQFSLQEKAWGYRYIEDSYQAIKGMGPSADLGITAQYQLTSWIAVDLSVTNGEGYKKVSNDNNYRYATGLTLLPFPELTLRAYADVYSGEPDNQQTLSLFAHYKYSAFSLGAEYNAQINHQFTKGNRIAGYSAYATFSLSERWNIFGRYDYAHAANNDNPIWYSGLRDLLFAGVEYRPLKQLRIAPNYRYGYAADPVHEIYVNVGFYW